MKLRWLVILLAPLTAFASDSRGQSKQPTPPPAQAAQTNQTSKPDERGSERSPIIVKILPTKESEEKVAADAHREDEKTENDRRLARFTELLFWVTGALSVIALFQLFVFGWQGFQLKQSVSAAKEATELGNREFISTHRPKIIVYGMDVKLPGDDQPRHIHFRYINAGDTDASVTFIESRILWTAKGMVPAGIELHRHDTIKEPIPVPSGMNGFAITPDGVDFATLVRSGRGGHDTAFCVGVVVYRDKNDVERRTGFCRRYDSERERWLRVEDEDYEYAY